MMMLFLTEVKKKERLDPKELIRRKLVELKRRAREEAEKNASERKKFLCLQLKPKSSTAAGSENSAAASPAASDELVFLFYAFTSSFCVILYVHKLG